MYSISRNRLPGELRTIQVDEIICHGKSAYQMFSIISTPTFGIVLVLDGIPQSSVFDEYIYHEMLVHSAMSLHPQPRSVLIIGGAEGATMREVLRYQSVVRAVMVDIDGVLVDACRKHLFAMHQGAFDDPRVELRIMDGRTYLETTSELFDCIILDLTDPIVGGPSYRLLTKEAMMLIKTRLTHNGLLSLQAEPAGPGISETHQIIRNTVSSVYSSIATLYAYIPLFGVPYGFVVGGRLARNEMLATYANQDTELDRRGITGLRFWDSETAISSSYLPRHIRDELGLIDTVATDHSPMVLSPDTLTPKAPNDALVVNLDR